MRNWAGIARSLALLRLGALSWSSDVGYDDGIGKEGVVMVLISGFFFKRIMIPLQRFIRAGTAALRSRAIARSLLSDG